MLIQNGTIVTPAGRRQAQILIAGGKIAAIIASDQVVTENPGQVIDASGCFVFAGGIDPHVHMHLPTSAGYSSDDFYTGSRAALFGGTTTLIDFVTPARNQPLTEALSHRKKEAEASLTDYSFHVSPVAWRDSLPDEIEACVHAGVTSFKVYMAYKDSIGLDHHVLEKVMVHVGRAGGMVTIHCEMGDEIDKLRNALFLKGKTEPSSHAVSRPPVTESRAVKAAIEMAGRTYCPLYIVHVSSLESLKHIRQARKQGQQVFAEVCPHHLLLDDAVYEAGFLQAAPYVFSPPLRKEADREALWEALADGTIQVAGTDHCPFMMDQKMRGIDDFRLIANGAGGVEHRLELLYTYGVLERRISLERMVEVTTANPARIFGLYPSKGILEPGSDADVVIWNPVAARTISSASHHQNCDHNIYEGLGVKGQASMVIAGGNIVIRNGKMPHEPAGRFLSREPIVQP